MSSGDRDDPTGEHADPGERPGPAQHDPAQHDPAQHDPAGQGPAGQPEPVVLLGELAGIRRRTRAARHAYWFPLVLFGLLTCAAAPLYVAAARPRPSGSYSAGGGITILGGMPGGGSGRYIGWYWLVALAGGYLATLLWYWWHARRAGLQTPARGFIITGVVLTVLAAGLPPLSTRLKFLQPVWLVPGDILIRGTFAFLIIAVGLWVLARAERSAGLVITALVYTGCALLVSLYNVENVLFRLGWNPFPADAGLTVLPGVLLPAVVLLIAGSAAFAVQRKSVRAPA